MLSFSIMYKCVSVLGRSVCIFVCKCVSCVFASLFVGVFMFVRVNACLHVNVYGWVGVFYLGKQSLNWDNTFTFQWLFRIR